MQKLSGSLVLLVVLLVAGCSEQTSPSEPDVEGITAVALLGPFGADAFYAKGDILTVVAHFPSDSAAPVNVISAAQSAVSRWNSEALDLEGYEDSLPHFNPTVIGGTSAPGTIVDLLYADECSAPDPQDCGYCGDWTEVAGVRGISIRRRNLTASCGGRIVDDLSGVIMHELSHVLGFKHTSGPGTEWCVTNVQGEGDLNPHLCRWEIQSVYAAYDLRNSDPAPTDTIASRIVILENPDHRVHGIERDDPGIWPRGSRAQ